MWRFMARGSHSGEGEGGMGRGKCKTGLDQEKPSLSDHWCQAEMQCRLE